MPFSWDSTDYHAAPRSDRLAPDERVGLGLTRSGNDDESVRLGLRGHSPGYGTQPHQTLTNA